VFDLNRSKAAENVKKLLPVLKRAQSKLKVLPRRVLKTSTDLEEAFEYLVLKPDSPNNSSQTTSSTPEPSVLPAEKVVATTSSAEKIVDISNSTIEKVKIKPFIAIDVTERAHFRHQNNRKQKRHSSGKHKRHSVKNTVASSSYRHILFLGATFPGSTHD